MAAKSGGSGGKYVDVKQGDTLLSLAHAEGFRNWEVIQDHPKNAALKNDRPGGHQLFAGDKVFIPSKKVEPFKVATDRRHSFVLRSLKAYVRVVVGDDREVYSGCRYLLTADGTDHEGQTDDQGLVEVQVPADCKEGTLKVWLPDTDQPVTWSVKLGHLDPIQTEEGIKGRLRNLGFDPGDSEQDYKTALSLFQERQGLTPSGELDDATRDKLQEQHLD